MAVDGRDCGRVRPVVIHSVRIVGERGACANRAFRLEKLSVRLKARAAYQIINGVRGVPDQVHGKGKSEKLVRQFEEVRVGSERTGSG